MFHVAPYLNASPSDPQQLGRKRHIGNDVVTIVFYEGNSPLKLDFGGFIRTCTATLSRKLTVGSQTANGLQTPTPWCSPTETSPRPTTGSR